jgi:hypothetical protein
MISKKQYIKPAVTCIKIDSNISLVMMTPPIDPPPQGGGAAIPKNVGVDNTFKSPFGDKPFS